VVKNQVRAFRIMAGLTLEGLAEEADTVYSVIWRIEHDKEEPSVYLAMRIANALHAPLDQLWPHG
jgi:DNA-binding XRE family transcriptional regulator